MNRILCFLLMMTCAHAATVSFDNSTKQTSPTDIKLRADTVTSSGTITTAKGIVQTSKHVTGTVIDWSDSGIQWSALSGDTTYTFSNVTADKSICFYLTANGFQPTFPLPSTNWDGSTIPTASASGEDTYVFTYVNGHYHGSFMPAGASGNTLYTGDGVLSGDRVVDGGGHSLMVTNLTGGEDDTSSALTFDISNTLGNPNSRYFKISNGTTNLLEIGPDIALRLNTGGVSVFDVSGSGVIGHGIDFVSIGTSQSGSYGRGISDLINGSYEVVSDAGGGGGHYFDRPVIGITLDAGSTWVTLLDPVVAASSTAYSLDTYTNHTSGNLLDIKNQGTNKAYITFDGGIATTAKNLVAPAAISFPATTVNWTNSNAYNIEVYVDNAGVTGSILKKNGTTIFSAISGTLTFHLQPGEYFSETYTLGTPTATWSPF